MRVSARSAVLLFIGPSLRSRDNLIYFPNEDLSPFLYVEISLKGKVHTPIKRGLFLNTLFMVYFGQSMQVNVVE